MKRYHRLWGLALCLLLIPTMAVANDFSDYKTAAGDTAVVNLPTVEAGWFVATDFFPEDTEAMIDGTFAAEGRLIAANNQSIYLQRTYGSSQWDVVGTVPAPMDPSFIHVSPDGSKIALGCGYGAPLAIIDTTTLSVSNPQLLFDTDYTANGVTVFPLVNYYDGDWVDNQYFVVNGGSWPSGCEPPYDSNPNCSFESGIGVVDTEDDDPSTHVGVPLVFGIPGSSGDVDVDSNGNLLTGIGFKTMPTNRTGELKVWAKDDWNPTSGSFTLQDYETTGAIVAENILSVAYLGEDAEGNLHVGGGDAFGYTPPYPNENGYAALIKAGIVADIADGDRTDPVNDGDKTDNGEYKYFAPDPCQDDSATGILAGNWGRGLAVMWNPTYYEDNGICYGNTGSASDYWSPGVTPRLTIYYPGSAPDSDGDGIVDASDNAYLTENPGQEDTDGDGYGNAVDADFDDTGVVDISDYQTFRNKYGNSATDSEYDMNSDGYIDVTDYQMFRGRYGTAGPWY